MPALKQRQAAAPSQQEQYSPQQQQQQRAAHEQQQQQGGDAAQRAYDEQQHRLRVEAQQQQMYNPPAAQYQYGGGVGSPNAGAFTGPPPSRTANPGGKFEFLVIGLGVWWRFSFRPSSVFSRSLTGACTILFWHVPRPPCTVQAPPPATTSQIAVRAGSSPRPAAPPPSRSVNLNVCAVGNTANRDQQSGFFPPWPTLSNS